MFIKAISKLEADEQAKYRSQYAWFSKKVLKALDDSGLQVISVDAQPYDPGMAVIPLNLEDFEADDFYILNKQWNLLYFAQNRARKKSL